MSKLRDSKFNPVVGFGPAGAKGRVPHLFRWNIQDVGSLCGAVTLVDARRRVREHRRENVDVCRNCAAIARRYGVPI